MNSNLFGMNHSTCCVNFVMKHTAPSQKDSNEPTASSIDENFYINDFNKLFQLPIPYENLV